MTKFATQLPLFLLQLGMSHQVLNIYPEHKYKLISRTKFLNQPTLTNVLTAMMAMSG